MIGERLDTVLPHSQFLFIYLFSVIYTISVDERLVDY